MFNLFNIDADTVYFDPLHTQRLY